MTRHRFGIPPTTKLFSARLEKESDDKSPHSKERLTA
jgi:hypothetical protein